MHEEVTYGVIPRAKFLVDGSYPPKVLLLVHQGGTPLRAHRAKDESYDRRVRTVTVAAFFIGDGCPRRNMAGQEAVVAIAARHHVDR
ncbi:hypothetical protein [Cupriavidus sp. SK-3]|uniref:hypothetical protein n=1 Tax=Cupriavidus sp. SK-3 TaxID=1470558 RepID=UPI0012692D1C|nr:hypothetical protein [Cupriavidus sp. SK-3]